MPASERPAIGDEKIAVFLDRLAGRDPAPGGGACAALQAAQGAALLGMVGRRSTGEQHAAHRSTIDRIITEVDGLRDIALWLADSDADGFSALAAAKRLPQLSEADKSARSAAIAKAQVGAAWPAARTISVAAMVADYADALVTICDRKALADLAAAAESARAAAATARLNVEINLIGVTDEQAALGMIAEADRVDGIIALAEHVTVAVRQQIRV